MKSLNLFLILTAFALQSFTISTQTESKANYSYQVGKLELMGIAETTKTITINDDIAVGKIVVSFTWEQSIYNSVGTLFLTSPAGTTIQVIRAPGGGTNSITLYDFSEENLKGTWTFKLTSDPGVGYFTAHDVVFEVDELLTTPIFTLDTNQWDAGEIQVNYSYSNNSFTIGNQGIDSIIINSITDLSTTDFSTSLVPADVNLKFGEEYSFNFTYLPTDFGTDSIGFLLSTNILDTIISLKGEGIKVADANFENGQVPDGWKIIDNDGNTHTWELYEPNILLSNSVAPHSGNWVMRSGYNFEGADDWLILPKLLPTTENDELFFWASSYSPSLIEDFKIMVSTTGNNIENFTTNFSGNLQAPAEWLKYSFDLSNYINQEIYIAIVHTSINKSRLFIDDVFAPIKYTDNNLKAINVDGDIAPNANSVVAYTATIKNIGLLTQTNYTVNLKTNSGTLISSQSGLSIERGEEIDYEFTTTFADVGEIGLYAEVIVANDEDLTNNKTDLRTIHVQPVTTNAVQVGNNTSLQSLIPVSIRYKNTLSQTIYYPHELKTGGYLNAINYFYNFNKDISDQQVKVWITETDTEKLIDDWLATEEFELVFNGELSFKKSDSIIHIPFNQPYLYHGKNLALMVERVYTNNSYYDEYEFYSTETPNNTSRTRVILSNYEIDIPKPSAGLVKDNIANTKFYFDDDKLGHVQGTVFNETGGTVNGAEVSILGTNVLTTTDANGNYNLSYISVGENLVKVSYFGYNDTIKNVTIVNGSTVTSDFNLKVRQKITVSGKVERSDKPGIALANANVFLQGYESYSTTTDANGNFEITNVWGNTTYTFTISSAECQNYVSDLPLLESDTNLGTLIINELAYEPENLLATVTDENNVELSWYSPNSGSKANKAFESYNIYRLVYGQENDTTNWELLSTNQTDTSYTDTNFSLLSYGFYKYAVIANYSNGVQSNAAISTGLAIDMTIPFTLNISTNASNSALGAIISMKSVNYNYVYTSIAPAEGVVVFDSIWRDTYIVSVSLPGFSPFVDSAFEITNEGSSLTVELQELILSPIDLLIDYSEENVKFLWTNIQTQNSKAVLNYNVYLNDTTVHLNTTNNEYYYFDNLTENVNYLAGVSSNYNGGTSEVASVRFVVPDFAQVSATVITNSADNALGANVTLELQDETYPYTYSKQVSENGLAVFNKIIKGSYILSTSLNGFETYVDSNFMVTDEGIETSIELTEILYAPVNLSLNLATDSTILNWNAGNASKAFATYYVYINDLDTPVDSTQNTSLNISAYINDGETVTAGVAAKYTTGTSSITKIQEFIPNLNIVNFNISSNNGSAEGALIQLWNNEGKYMNIVPANEQVQFINVPNGNYKFSVSLIDFNDIEQNIYIGNDTTITIELKEFIIPTYNPQIIVNGTNAIFSWNTGEYMFKDSFEEGTLGDSWELIKGEGTTTGSGLPHWNISDIKAYNGSFAAVCEWGTNINTWLITPEMYIKDNDIVSFAWYSNYYWSVSPNNNSDLFIEISTDNGETWEYIWTYGEIGVWNDNTWYETQLSLNKYAGKTVKIGFHLVGSDNSPNLIDQIYVGEGSSEQGTRKMGITSQNYNTSKEFPISQKSGSNKALQSFKVYLNNMETPFTTTTEKTYTFNDLEYNTSYKAGVSSVFETGESKILTIDFATKTPTNMVTFNVDMNGVDGFNALSDTLYLTGSFSEWAIPGQLGSYTMIDSDGDLIFTALVEVHQGDIEYKYFVNSGWDGGEPISNNRTTTISTETTLNDVWGEIVSVNDQENYSTKIYPNPSIGSISINSSESISKVIIYNTMGVVVKTINNKFNNIDISNITNGIYLFEVYSNHKVSRQQIILSK